MYKLLNLKVRGEDPARVMVKLHGRLIVLICFLAVFSGRSQDTEIPPDNLFREFKNTPGSEARFDIFFNTQDRYVENSAYDWVDALKEYTNIAETDQDSVAIRHYRLMLAEAYYDIGNYDRSVAIAKDLLYGNEKNLEEGHIEILLNLLDKNYEQLSLFGKQVEIRQQKRDRGLTKLISFYDIYANLGHYRQAIIYYTQEEKAKIAEDDYFGLAHYNNNIGNYLRLDRSPSTAITWLSKAKGFVNVFLNDKSRKKTEDQIKKAHLLHSVIEGNLGKCFVQLGQYEEAIPYLKEALSGAKEYPQDKQSPEEVECTLALAECHIQLNNFQLATDLLSTPLNISNPDHRIKRNRLYALFYEKTGDFENATRYLRNNMRISDSLELTSTARQKQQLAAVAGYEIANERRKNDEQRIENERIRRDFETQEGKTNLVFISLVFTLLGFAGLVYAYLKSIKNQRLIAEQNHIIEASLVEKDSLLKEIHHRVKNNLQMVSSLLSLQTKNTRSKAAIEALEEGKSRVKAMALIHQKLYQNDDLSVIEMQGYIESLVNSVQSVFKKGGHNINITIDAEGVELDIDRAIPFGLILNELVSNSFKYAFPDDKENGKIYIHLRKSGDQGFFEYMDNGVGLPEDTEERTQSSMGIRLMNRLVNQLQSTLNIDKTTDGVRFWFDFK